MPLIVPLLRLFLLFLNVFETFKTLRPPPRSVRTGERTLRALSQRKRDMKGCVAIWLVWCSCAVMEGIADNTVGILMPFYNEFKAIIFLFQILTRARGAEPIYLHVMKPLVKPYVTTLDWALELVQMIGDFVMLVISLPFTMVAEWWNPSASAAVAPEPVEVAAEQQAERVHKPRQPSNGSTVELRKRGSRQASGGSAGRSDAGSSRIPRPDGFPHSTSDTTMDQKHKIWRPPANAYGPDEGSERPRVERRVASDSAASSRPSAVNSSAPIAATHSRAESYPDAEDWRRYPPFPSAYPATPQISNGSLSKTSSSSGAPNGLYDVDETSDAGTLVEEWRQYPPFPSAYPATPQVASQRIAKAPSSQRQSDLDSLEEKRSYQSELYPSVQPQPRERRIRTKEPVRFWAVARAAACESDVCVDDFGLHDGSGDRKQTFGERITDDMQGGQMDDLEDMEVDDGGDGAYMDEDEEEDEDDFNVTLRTPARLKITTDTEARKRSRSSSRSSSPSEQQIELISDEEQQQAGNRERARAPSFASLAVPAAYNRRTNSNYTLSSERTNSMASFTTASRTSSFRTMSREPSTISGAPSLGSKSSSGCASEYGASDTNSVAGVKRPRTVVEGNAIDKGRISSVQMAKRPVNRLAVRGQPEGPNKAPRDRTRTTSVRSSDSRPVRTGLKPSVKGDRRKPGVTGIDAYDTLGSTDEATVTSRGTVPVKRRKVRMGGSTTGAAARPDPSRPGLVLAQIPEEKSGVTRPRPHQPRDTKA
ncbi:hypothetical protein M0805_006977 [Coniferiporia weirii]|nr:hypothetical protein M0805_006977 [Coniferiporia weirii]